MYFFIQVLGMEETSARINAMVEIGKQNIEMSETIPLDSLVNIKKNIAIRMNSIND